MLILRLSQFVIIRFFEFCNNLSFWVFFLQFELFSFVQTWIIHKVRWESSRVQKQVWGRRRSLLMLPWSRKINSLRQHTASSWERSDPNSESLIMKTITPTPSSIWEFLSFLLFSFLLLLKWQDLWQSHITKYSVLDPNLSSLRPSRSCSTSNLLQV